MLVACCSIGDGGVGERGVCNSSSKTVESDNGIEEVARGGVEIA